MAIADKPNIASDKCTHRTMFIDIAGQTQFFTVAHRRSAEALDASFSSRGCDLSGSPIGLTRATRNGTQDKLAGSGACLNRNSSMKKATRFVGPAGLAGVVLAVTMLPAEAAWNSYINREVGFSFLAPGDV